MEYPLGLDYGSTVIYIGVGNSWPSAKSLYSGQRWWATHFKNRLLAQYSASVVASLNGSINIEGSGVKTPMALFDN